MQDLFAGSVEFAFDVGVRGADTGMDTRPAGVPEGGGGDFDIFLYGAAQSADGGILDDPGYFFDGMEITGAGDGEAGFDDVDAQGLQLERQARSFLWY